MPASGYGMQRTRAPQYGAAAPQQETTQQPPLAQPQQATTRAPAPQPQAAPAPITSTAMGGIPNAGGGAAVSGALGGGLAQQNTGAAAPAGVGSAGTAATFDPNSVLSHAGKAGMAAAGFSWAKPDYAGQAPPTQMDDWQQQWSDIYADYEKSLPEQFRQADLAAASQGRRQNELNSIMGGTGGLGGMYGSTMAQMGLTGQNLRMEAQAKHDRQGLEMKLGWLDQQIKLAEAQNNRDLAAQLQEEQNKTQLAIAQAEAGMTPDAGGGGYNDDVTPDQYSPTTINEFNMNAGVRQKMPWEIREGDL